MSSIREDFASTAEEQLVGSFMDAVVAGEAATIDRLLADDAVWSFPGKFDFSGTHTGKAAIFEGLFAAAAQLFEPGRLVIEVRHMISSGNVVVLEYTGHNRTGDGSDYANEFIFVFEVGDGEIRKVREYCDTQHMAAALFGTETGAQEDAS